MDQGFGCQAKALTSKFAVRSNPWEDPLPVSVGGGAVVEEPQAPIEGNVS